MAVVVVVIVAVVVCSNSSRGFISPRPTELAVVQMETYGYRQVHLSQFFVFISNNSVTDVELQVRHLNKYIALMVDTISPRQS